MPLDALTTLVPPPAKPRHARIAGAWEKAEAALGLSLPADWRALGQTFGSGTFREAQSRFWYLWIYNPLSPRFVEHVREVCDQQRETETRHETVFELHPFFPDAGGYFPLGEDDAPNTYWFRMAGPPDEWPIVVWGGAGSEWVMTIAKPLGDFLADFLSGRVAVWGYEEWSPRGVRFEGDRKV